MQKQNNNRQLAKTNNELYFNTGQPNF